MLQKSRFLFSVKFIIIILYHIIIKILYVCAFWFKRLKNSDLKNLKTVISVSSTNNNLKAIESATTMEPLLAENSVQTQREFAEQLGVTQQTISKCLYEMEKIKKKENGFRINSTETNKNQGVFLFSISSVENLSCEKSLRAMKNGYSMTIRNARSHG